MICIVPLYEGSEQTLGDVVIHEMCVEEEGNVNPRQDPHGELVNKNVLTRIHSKVMQKIKVGDEMTNLIIEISIPKPSHFVWTKSDLKTVSKTGDYRDASLLTKKNVCQGALSLEERSYKRSLKAGLEALHRHRLTRPRPALDDKVSLCVCVCTVFVLSCV